MAVLQDIVAYCDQKLRIETYVDYCPNGLQIAGSSEVKALVSGVTASAALIETAIDIKADAILVHHGYFWKGEDPRIIGIKYNRIKKLIENNISLIAYHLPLDGHPQLGNNACLAERLGIYEYTVAADGPGKGLLCYCDLKEPLTVAQLSDNLNRALNRKPMIIKGGAELISSVGWCTGGAQSMIDQSIHLGLDAYISGEISEQTTHSAIEGELHYFSAGHHATERFGVKALGEHLERKFEINHYNVDIPNPV